MLQFDDTDFNKSTGALVSQQEEELLAERASSLGFPYINLTAVGIQTDALVVIPEERAKKLSVAAFKLVGRDLHIGAKNPDSPLIKTLVEELARKKYEVQLYLVSLASLQKAWERYGDVNLTEKSSSSLVDISLESIRNITELVKSNEDIRSLFFEAQAMNQGKVSRMIEVVLGSAIATDSSDVHFEPQEEQVRLRFRQDGVLKDIAFFEGDLYRLLSSRLKILSGMKITNDSDAQDGRFTIEYKGVPVEVRSSTIPSAYGEGFVMRILNPEGLAVDMGELGINANLLEILKDKIVKPNGLILTTGPTGSGKTTTLYSFLKYIYNPDIKILTIEDPIEYHLEGINQTQVNHDEGYDFLSGLRAALRQDPDVIMVGEIRDNETATIAVNASLTGHMVLSTLHTNNAAGTIPRLLDLGVKADILANAMSVSMAQRLVRKLCVHCKEKYRVNEKEANIIDRLLNYTKEDGKDLSMITGKYEDGNYSLFKAPGCEKCGGDGYTGRVGLFEAILMDGELELILANMPNERDVWRATRHQKILNMAEDGVVKALLGETSLEEVKKVVDLEGYIDMRKPVSVDEPVTREMKRSGVSIPSVSVTNRPVENIIQPAPVYIQPQAMPVVPNEIKIQVPGLDKIVELLSHREQVIPEKKVVEVARSSEVIEKNKDAEVVSKNEKVNDIKRKELMVLIEYLRTLEEHQEKYPEVSVAERIVLSRKALVDLVSSFSPDELFMQRHNDKSVREELSQVVDKLDKLQSGQREEPEKGISSDIGDVRKTLKSMAQ